MWRESDQNGGRLQCTGENIDISLSMVHVWCGITDRICVIHFCKWTGVLRRPNGNKYVYAFCERIYDFGLFQKKVPMLWPYVIAVAMVITYMPTYVVTSHKDISLYLELNWSANLMLYSLVEYLVDIMAFAYFSLGKENIVTVCAMYSVVHKYFQYFK